MMRLILGVLLQFPKNEASGTHINPSLGVRIAFFLKTFTQASSC